MEIIRYIKGHREIQNITIENNKNEVRQVNSGMAYILLIMSCLILLFFPISFLDIRYVQCTSDSVCFGTCSS